MASAELSRRVERVVGQPPNHATAEGHGATLPPDGREALREVRRRSRPIDDVSNHGEPLRTVGTRGAETATWWRTGSTASAIGERLNAARRRDPIPERTCRTCGETFIPVRKDQNYCRTWCRQHKYLTRLESESR